MYKFKNILLSWDKRPITIHLCLIKPYEIPRSFGNLEKALRILFEFLAILTLAPGDQ